MSTPLPDPIHKIERRGDVSIHTFVSSLTDTDIANATHIIESENQLVLVDGQFLAFYAKEFRAYAARLNKPIKRLYLSHRHPDHWFGLGTESTRKPQIPYSEPQLLFADIDIYALHETIEFLKVHGQESIHDHQGKLGDQAPKHLVIPKNVASPGPETIDGVKYVFRNVTNTEIDFHLTIELPEIGVCILQDLIYSKTHLYLRKPTDCTCAADLTKDIGNWIKVLQEFVSLGRYDLFLAGHGFPATEEEVLWNIAYLSTAKQAIDQGKSKYDFKKFMLDSYPERKCPKIFDIYLPRLFDNARDY